MPRFPYGKTETDYLSQQDPSLAAAITRIGPLSLEMTPDLFTALTDAIISQQLSDKAARTIQGRFRALLGEVVPERIIATSPEQLRTCGISLRKAEYILHAAKAALEGKLNPEKLHSLRDEELCRQLMTLPGVGKWTAEMLMIFALGRPDIVSYGDLAIRRGMMRLYGLQELSRATFETYRRRYSPYGTVVSFYLWRIAHEEETTLRQ